MSDLVSLILARLDENKAVLRGLEPFGDIGGPLAPVRVLADIEVKRRIVELHAPVEGRHSSEGPYCASCGDQGCCGHQVDFPCETLKSLAAALDIPTEPQ